MGNKGRKGGEFEREIAYSFSRWWTNGQRDDIFWRSASSGGRATNRTRAAKTTEGHYGDLAATHPSGKPFTDLITLEMKCGYSTTPIFDVVDRPTHGACTTRQVWDEHLAQAIKSHEDAGSYSWLVVARRVCRPTWAYMPRYLSTALRGVGAMATPPRPFVAFTADYRTVARVPGKTLFVVGVTLDYFFANVTPQHIHRLTKKLGR